MTHGTNLHSQQILNRLLLRFKLAHFITSYYHWNGIVSIQQTVIQLYIKPLQATMVLVLELISRYLCRILMDNILTLEFVLLKELKTFLVLVSNFIVTKDCTQQNRLHGTNLMWTHQKLFLQRSQGLQLSSILLMKAVLQVTDFPMTLCSLFKILVQAWSGINSLKENCFTDGSEKLA